MTLFQLMQRIFNTYYNQTHFKRIFGIAYNYGVQTPINSQQIWFDKPLTSVIFDGEPLRLPWHFNQIAHEVELGMLIGLPGKNILRADAMKHVQAYFLAIDFTNRGLGAQFKKDGAPWCLQKGSDGFTAVSDFVDADQVSGPVRLILKVDGHVRQDFSTAEMLHKIEDQVCYLSKHCRLNEGDMILTGTGAGVGIVKRGDIVETSMQWGNGSEVQMKTPVL